MEAHGTSFVPEDVPDFPGELHAMRKRGRDSSALAKDALARVHRLAHTARSGGLKETDVARRIREVDAQLCKAGEKLKHLGHLEKYYDVSYEVAAKVSGVSSPRHLAYDYKVLVAQCSTLDNGLATGTLAVEGESGVRLKELIDSLANDTVLLDERIMEASSKIHLGPTTGVRMRSLSRLDREEFCDPTLDWGLPRADQHFDVPDEPADVQGEPAATSDDSSDDFWEERVEKYVASGMGAVSNY